ncbi:MAG: DUF2934 domain-containing protein [Alphaproteobacteria bacterium]|nr:DUF2934 domain-containing protein [Alphaproteobacteria bacterium]MDE2630637.1 DUF2934 domain-containing protein [Alphaproteobacteria bacterium]
MIAKHSNPTVESLRHQIEVRAYLLWERSGRPMGCGQDYWLLAEKEILGELKNKAPTRKKSMAAPAPKAASAPKRNVKAKKK